MIDIHSHILPGIDDGAEDMYDALEMARMALESGVTAMVTTPHCNIPGIYDNYYGEYYKELFRETEKALKAENIPLKLYTGMEVFMNSQVPRLISEGKVITINNGRFMLVEFGFDEEPEYMLYMLNEISSIGIQPIVAHPERYECIQENPSWAYHIRRKGYLLQLNKGSLMGRFGRRTAYTAHSLMNHNLVSAIASDCHSPIRRTPHMLDVYEELLYEYPEKLLKILFEENPLRICDNQPVISFKLKPYAEEW